MLILCGVDIDSVTGVTEMTGFSNSLYVCACEPIYISCHICHSCHKKKERKKNETIEKAVIRFGNGGNDGGDVGDGICTGKCIGGRR